MSTEAKDDVNEEEVHQLFNLIDTERTGYITPAVRFKPNYIYKMCMENFQQAKKAGELIRERFAVDEVRLLDFCQIPISQYFSI